MLRSMPTVHGVASIHSRARHGRHAAAHGGRVVELPAQEADRHDARADADVRRAEECEVVDQPLVDDVAVERKQEAVDVERVDVVDGKRRVGRVRPLRGIAGKLEPPQLHVPAEGHREGKLAPARVGLEQDQALGRGEVGGGDVAWAGDASEAGGHHLVDSAWRRASWAGSSCVSGSVRYWEGSTASSKDAARTRVRPPASPHAARQPVATSTAVARQARMAIHHQNRVRSCRLCRIFGPGEMGRMGHGWVSRPVMFIITFSRPSRARRRSLGASVSLARGEPDTRPGRSPHGRPLDGYSSRYRLYLFSE